MRVHRAGSLHRTRRWPAHTFPIHKPGTARAQYDNAGNLVNDNWSSFGSASPGVATRTYDAENRMTSAQDSTGGTTNYTYDADGRRVRRTISGQPEVWQVYGLSGELLAEYTANASYATPQKEYGYRSGQLLVTATTTSGWGAVPVLHDNPLVVGETTVQARHITELRAAIDALRTHLNMSPYSWQYSATTSDWISANPILEMRTALDQALGGPSGGYTSGLAQGQPIKAIHVQELRDRVLAAWVSGGGVDLRWLVSDQLGTPRMIFDQTGSLANVGRHDYLPFGEELFAGTGGRTTAQGYSASDGVRQHFTLKERDNETGLDYFGARYYGSTQGRFTSPDAFDKDSDLDDPQSWNKYVYVRNNPLYFVDPSGEKAEVTVTTDEEHKRRTITIHASFAVYAAAGQKVSQKELQKQANLIKSQIESTYSGSATKNGYSYQISTTVDVKVVADEKAAINAGVDNIVEIGNKSLVTQGGINAGGAGYHLAGESFDRMIATTQGGGMASGNGFAHEFGHLLGDLAHLPAGNVMVDTLPAGSSLTDRDKDLLLGGFLVAHQYLGTGTGQLSSGAKPMIPSYLRQAFKTRTVTQAPTEPPAWIGWK